MHHPKVQGAGGAAAWPHAGGGGSSHMAVVASSILNCVTSSVLHPSAGGTLLHISCLVYTDPKRLNTSALVCIAKGGNREHGIKSLCLKCGRCCALRICSLFSGNNISV